MKPIAKILVVGWLLLATTAFGFDGLRKGFVLGGGAGLTPLVHSESKVDFTISHSCARAERLGLGLQFMIGNGFNESNMLVFELTITGHGSDSLREGLTRGFTGAVWYHYYGRAGKSLYSSAGLGLQFCQVSAFERIDTGLALRLGGGYEFARHWQVGTTLTVGRNDVSNFESKANLSYAQLDLILSGVLF